jgi:DNA-binding NtrC family response regulator
VDVRVIAATNRDLQKDMQDGVFRPDLYYRLAVFPVHMPPLRDRPEDVSVLAQTMLHQLARRHGRKTLTLAPETKAVLRCHSWPGNVRELKNTLERGVLLEDGQVLHPAALQLSSSSGLQPHQADGANDVFQVPQTRDDLLPLDTVERIWLRRALDLCDWNIREVSRRLGVGRATIARRIDLYGWEAPGVAESSAADN